MQKKNEFQILERKLFGEFSRYELARCRDRFGEIVYMVSDAETPDPLIPSLPSIIRQTKTREEAIQGLT